MAGQVQRKLRQVSGVHAKLAVRPVDRSIKELPVVANHEVPTLRRVAQRARRVAVEQGTNTAGDHPGGRHPGGFSRSGWSLSGLRQRMQRNGPVCRHCTAKCEKTTACPSCEIAHKSLVRFRGSCARTEVRPERGPLPYSLGNFRNVFGEVSMHCSTRSPLPQHQPRTQ